MANRKPPENPDYPDAGDNRRSRRSRIDRNNLQPPAPPPSRNGPRWPTPDQPPANNPNNYQPLGGRSNTPPHSSSSRRSGNTSNVPLQGSQPPERDYHQLPRQEPIINRRDRSSRLNRNAENNNSQNFVPPIANNQPNVPTYRPTPRNANARPQPNRSSNGGASFGRITLYVFLALFIVAALAGLFIYTRLTSLANGITVQRVDVNNQPISGSSFNGHDSVNIALLGLDTRPGNPDGTRSDTIIIVRVNPQTKAASMISIPRDLWVDIPGYGQNRINAAYTYGDAAHPGTGGPPLVEATIQKNFGLHIDYFAEVDFEDFEQVIDAIGGVTIDVQTPLIDSQFPTLDYGVKRIYIPAGIQHMDGKTAVEYARSRHADSDLARNTRQQQVLLAIRQQGVNLGLLTNNQLQTALARAIRTDLQVPDILSLAQIAGGMNQNNIHNFQIDFNMAVPTDNGAGNVLMPQWTAIHTLVNQFTSSTDQAAPTTTTLALNAANVEVVNGTYTDGLAANTQKFLQGKGFNVVGVENASNPGSYPNTVIKVFTGKHDIANALAQQLGVGSSNVQDATNGPAGVDIEVICGNNLNLPATG